MPSSARGPVQGLKRPIYQVMASGMDVSTAKGLETGCAPGAQCCSWNFDHDGLRGPNKTCNIYGDPNFGIAEFDWDMRHLALSVRRGDGGGVAAGADGVPIRLTLDMDSCLPVHES
jgi:hypothetical protein